MIRFDVARGAVSWEQSGMYASNPVIANGVLYVNAGFQLEARSRSTGALLWAWSAPGSMDEYLLIVGNLAFVAAFGRTHAVDLTTRQSVWSYPATGPLAVSSNGIPYIAPPGQLVAINLH
jgi:outer membrane protein assembly factor BamB